MVSLRGEELSTVKNTSIYCWQPCSAPHQWGNGSVLCGHTCCWTGRGRWCWGERAKHEQEGWTDGCCEDPESGGGACPWALPRGRTSGGFHLDATLVAPSGWQSCWGGWMWWSCRSATRTAAPTGCRRLHGAPWRSRSSLAAVWLCPLGHWWEQRRFQGHCTAPTWYVKHKPVRAEVGTDKHKHAFSCVLVLCAKNSDTYDAVIVPKHQPVYPMKQICMQVKNIYIAFQWSPIIKSLFKVFIVNKHRCASVVVTFLIKCM